MRQFLGRFYLVVLLTLIWCILNEKFTLGMVISGIVVSFITMFFLRIIQPNPKEKYSYNTSLFRLFLFFIILIRDIYMSAFRAIKHLIKNEINPQFVATETRVRKPWLQAIIANAITLTPGTVTVHLSEGSYTVLWLYPLTIRSKDIKKHLIDDFERVLIKEDRHA